MVRGSNFSVCVHILVLLAHFEEEFVSSDFIAGSIQINPVMVRKEIIKLKAAGLVESKGGKTGGTRIAKSTKDITMLDIYQAVNDTDTHIFQMCKNDPNARCPIGAQINTRLENLYQHIDNEVERLLEGVSLQSFYQTFQFN